VACADAVQHLLERDVTGRRRLARQQAERFGWPSAVHGFLHAHGLAAEPDLPGAAAAAASAAVAGAAATAAGGRGRDGTSR
jgi:alpha-1,6-mannosyltransferase